MSWANDLVTRFRFSLHVESDDDINYTITLTRNENVPEWLRCCVEARLYVEEDQRDRRMMGQHCSLLVDCRYTQEMNGPEVSFEVPFTPAGIAKGRHALASLLSEVR